MKALTRWIGQILVNLRSDSLAAVYAADSAPAQSVAAGKPNVLLLLAERCVDYRLGVVAICPKLPGIEEDSRYDGFRRDCFSADNVSTFVSGESHASFRQRDRNGLSA